MNTEASEDLFEEPRRSAKERVITFRVNDEEYDQIERAARRRGEKPNEWCRNLALSESVKPFGLSASERILLEEVGVIRHLFGRFLKRSWPLEEYEKLREEVEQHYVEIGETLLQRRTGAREF